MLLRAFHISDRQLRHWLANRAHLIFWAHKLSFTLLYPTRPSPRQIRILTTVVYLDF
jgi:hypothetical protein